MSNITKKIQASIASKLMDAGFEEAADYVMGEYMSAVIGDICDTIHARVPERWQLVPVEPTQEMIEQGELTDELYHSVASVTDVYKAMIAAAPVSMTDEGGENAVD